MKCSVRQAAVFDDDSMASSRAQSVPLPSPRQRPGRGALRVACALAGAVLASNALALDEGRTEQGVHYLSGGVALDEREALQAQRGQHSLWVVVATAGSGAYTGDTQVVIHDATGKVVFDRALDGPWLFIDLPAGRYAVEARGNGVSQRRQTRVHPGDHHQVIFRLPAPADAAAPASSRRAPTSR